MGPPKLRRPLDVCHQEVEAHLHDASQQKQAFYLQRIVAPILGIEFAKIAAKALNQRTIIFKLVLSVVICFLCLGHSSVTGPDF